MGFKKVRYNTGDNILRIKIEDESGKFLENWTVMMSDLYIWVETMRRKFGIEHKREHRDLDWAR